MFSAIAIPLLVAIILRVLPIMISDGGQGVDHWYWKLYVESYRKDGHFPPVLPGYALDEYQWYPPLFPLMLACLPDKVWNEYNRLVAVVLDLLRMGLVLVAACYIGGGDHNIVIVSGLIYAVTPILISYNAQLNPRGLGALFLDAMMVLLLICYHSYSSYYLVGVIVLLSAMILLTHKMTTQLFWFLCLGFFFFTFDYRILLLIPVSILLALVLSKGFYLNVLKAHWDIVGYWYRNWPWLQAHPLKESPLYGIPGYETPTRFYRKGWKGLAQHLRYLVGFAPAVWMLLAALGLSALSINFADRLILGLIGWAACEILFALLTIFIPFMRCLGAGYLYLYNAAFPVALLWGMLFQSGKQGNLVVYIFAFSMVLSFLALLAYYRKTFQSGSQELNTVEDFLRNVTPGMVMCFPPQMYDYLAYNTGHTVLYGGHGYGLKELEPLFPRLMIPIADVIKQYNLKYMVVGEGDATERFLADLQDADYQQIGLYKIFIF